MGGNERDTEPKATNASGSSGTSRPQRTGRRRVSQRQGRGRPRDEAFDGRILEAAFDELARCGISHFSVSAVAQRAGVAKGTIYLRWPTREQLMLDASQLVMRPLAPPKPGSFRKQLSELVDHFAAIFGEHRSVEMTLRIDADRYRHPELFAQMFTRIQAAGAPDRRGDGDRRTTSRRDRRPTCSRRWSHAPSSARCSSRHWRAGRRRASRRSSGASSCPSLPVALAYTRRVWRRAARASRRASR